MGAPCLTFEKPGKHSVKPAVNGKSNQPNPTKEKLVESPNFKVAVQPGKQIGSDESELASEGKSNVLIVLLSAHPPVILQLTQSSGTAISKVGVLLVPRGRHK